MLTWDIQAIEAFLQCRAVNHANSSVSFGFAMLGGTAMLHVFPYNGEARLTVDIPGQSASATWHLECSAITTNDESPEEGGSSLAFIPKVPANAASQKTHWVVLGREANGFSILTVLRDNQDAD